MLRYRVGVINALKCLRMDQDGVVSFEYVAVAGCVVGAVITAFGSNAGGSIATALTTVITAIGTAINAVGG